MKLWTLQPHSVAEKLKAGEPYVCDPLISSFSNDDDFIKSYDWLVSEMAKVIPQPEHVRWPAWAWHTNYGVQTKPDRRRGMFNNYDELDSILELEVPDELVLLSDFDDWHCVLNNCAIMSDEEYEAWPEKDEWDCAVYTDEFKLDSWKKVFRSNTEFVQACIWTIEPEYLVKVHPLRKKAK